MGATLPQLALPSGLPLTSRHGELPWQSWNMNDAHGDGSASGRRHWTRFAKGAVILQPALDPNKP
jgi:hypothetical protein